MNFDDIYAQILYESQNISVLEWISTLAQVMSVIFAQRNHIWVYPTGILGVLTAAWVYFFAAHPPLYAEGFLHLYYCGISIYGWYNWKMKIDDSSLIYPIRWCTSRERTSGIVLFLATWLIISLILSQWTNSDTPYLDAVVSASAITAMWWMTTRKIDNWLAWIFSNFFAIPLNFYKGFYLFTFMYLLFLILAYIGYRQWLLMYKSSES